MYGTPQPLYPVVPKSQKMFGDTGSMYGLSIGRNTFYSIKDGNWNDTTIWESVNRNTGSTGLPASTDEVYIRHTVACNITASVNNLFISGTLTSATNTITLSVNGDIQCAGSISFTSSISLFLYGINNYISTFSAGTTSTIGYTRASGDQSVLSNITYSGLTLSNGGTKTASGNITTTGVLTVGGNVPTATAPNTTFQIGSFDLSVGGATNVGTGGASPSVISKIGAGSLLFTGLLTSSSSSIIDFSGNPTIECRGGYSWNNVTFTSGTGAWTFTTNNQSISNVNAVYQFNGTVTIVGAITVTNVFATATVANGTMQINLSLDGTVAGSTFLNNGQLFMNVTTNPMATGVFDITTTATNVVGYIFNGGYTLQYTAYKHLYIAGTGTKTLSGTTTLSGALTVGNVSGSIASVLELSTFDLTVGTTTTTNGSVAKISKTGAGNILFTGLIALGNNAGSTVQLDFSGNPTVELRGGIQVVNASSTTINSGTGVWTFSTNNQSITTTNTSGGATIAAPILISGAITLTITGTSATLSTLTLTGVLNGNNASSTYDNRMVTNYQNATQPMATGVLQVNAAANTFKYNLTGAQAVKGTTYRTNEMGGSGNKTLQANLVTNVTGGGAQTVTGTAVIVLNGFTNSTI